MLQVGGLEPEAPSKRTEGCLERGRIPKLRPFLDLDKLRELGLKYLV